ncbi:MAG: hypothetical protein Q9173_000863 [Seirophora scorigena]
MTPPEVSPKLPLYLYSNGRRSRPGQVVVDADARTWYRAADEDHWQKAAFHWALRKHLIREAAKKGAYQTWSDKKGRVHSRGDPVGPDDLTAFHPGQNWTLERANRPPKTFQFLRTEETEPSDPIEDWVWRGFLVLDHHGNPLRAFKALPVAISSKEDGCFLEGMFREDPRISWEDIVARVPYKEVPRPSASPEETPVLYEAVVNHHRMSVRCARFRKQAACISWKPREGTDKLRRHLESYLPPECVAMNSTRSFRDLTDLEVAEISRAAKGTHPERAGKNALSEADRKLRMEIFEEKLEQMAQREAGRAVARPAKRLRKAPATDYISSGPSEASDSRDNRGDAGPQSVLAGSEHEDLQAVSRFDRTNKEASNNARSKRLRRPFNGPSRRSSTKIARQPSQRRTTPPWRSHTNSLHQQVNSPPQWKTDDNSLHQSTNYPPWKPSMAHDDQGFDIDYAESGLDNFPTATFQGYPSTAMGQAGEGYLTATTVDAIDPQLAEYNYPPVGQDGYTGHQFAYPPPGPALHTPPYNPQHSHPSAAFQAHHLLQPQAASFSPPAAAWRAAATGAPPIFAADYREVIPITAAEREAVDTAIEATCQRLRDLLFQIHGDAAAPLPPMPYGQTYGDAHRTLNGVLREAWVANGREGEAPALPSAGVWRNAFPRVDRTREDGGLEFF